MPQNKSTKFFCQMTLFRAELRTCRRILKVKFANTSKYMVMNSLLWSLQVDESTDISGQAQLLAFIRLIKNATFENEYLFCQYMKTTTMGKGILRLVNGNIVLIKL